MTRCSIFTGEQIRAGRAMARIDQTALAERSGVSLETIKRIEGVRGPVETNASTHAALLRAFAELCIEFESYGLRGAGVRGLAGGVDAEAERGERQIPDRYSPERYAPKLRSSSPLVVDSAAFLAAKAKPPTEIGMIAYWDCNLRCRYANDGYLEWFGRSGAEMVGLPIQTLMGKGLFRDNEGLIRTALSGVAQTFERTLQKPSGAVGHTLVRYLPDRDPSGAVAGFRVMAADITPLKTAEMNLAKTEAALRETRRQVEAALQINMGTVDALAAERIAARAGPPETRAGTSKAA